MTGLPEQGRVFIGGGGGPVSLGRSEAMVPEHGDWGEGGPGYQHDSSTWVTTTTS